jgi:hypothetical protein
VLLIPIFSHFISVSHHLISLTISLSLSAGLLRFFDILINAYFIAFSSSWCWAHFIKLHFSTKSKYISLSAQPKKTSKMPSIKQILFLAPSILSVAYGQGVVLSAQGTKGSPASLGLQVQTNVSDANIINANEIATNVVNECGRTLLGGNIDIGENTETQLAAKTVTSVTKGSTLQMTINPLNSDGAGPYSCDVDLTGNADGTSGQTNLTVKETTAANGNINLAITMPNDLACIGASTGNVCTIRCFNTATTGPFGGCVAVKQTDITPNANTPGTIKTAQTLEGVDAQIAQNQKDLPTAVKANQDATLEEQGVKQVDALLKIDSAALATAGAAAASGTSTAAAKATTTAKATAKATATTAAGKTGKANGAKAQGNGKGAKASAAANSGGAKAASASTGQGRNNKRFSRVFIS